MSDFDTSVQEQQLNWRSEHIDTKELGEQNGKKRPWILPKELWEEGLWPGIQSSSAHSLTNYLEKNDIEKHDGVHNLKSSWVLCANLYFPFRRDPTLLAGFLKEKVSSLIESVDTVELEYAEEPPLGPAPLLGEPAKGKRGKNQTSPDVAFILNNGKGLILTENKYTEHSFYECSGRNKDYGNTDPSRCLDFKQLYSDLEHSCYQLHWGNKRRPNRKYWNYLKVSENGQKILKRCPAAVSGCQLFRQQALAEGIAERGNYDFVISCVAYDNKNQTLISCLKSTGIDDFRAEWSNLFDGKAGFKSFSHQQFVTWIRENDSDSKWKDWLSYVKNRYGY